MLTRIGSKIMCCQEWIDGSAELFVAFTYHGKFWIICADCYAAYQGMWS